MSKDRLEAFSDGVIAIAITLLVLNLLLLLCIGVLPFSTALLAEYLRERSGQHLAAAIYGGSFLLMSVAFYALQHHMLFARAHLLRGDIELEERRGIARRGRFGLIPYALAMAAAPLSAYLTLVICAAIALYYALPSTTAGPTRSGAGVSDAQAG